MSPFLRIQTTAPKDPSKLSQTKKKQQQAPGTRLSDTEHSLDVGEVLGQNPRLSVLCPLNIKESRLHPKHHFIFVDEELKYEFADGFNELELDFPRYSTVAL